MPQKRFTFSLLARIVFIVLMGQIALIALGGWALSLRDGAAARAQDAAILRDMGMAWRATAATAAADLARLADDPALAAAADAEDPRALAAVLAPLEDRFGGARIEILEAGGRLLLNSGGEFSWRPTLGAEQAAAVLAGRPVAGLHLDWARTVVAAHGRPLGGDRVLVLSVPADRLLADFARLMGGEVLVVNRRGRPLAGTDDALAQALPLDHGPLDRQDVQVDGRTLSLASLALDDAGGLAARLVLVRDVSALAGEMRAIQAWAIGGAGGALVLLVGGVALYLRRAFAPLKEAVAVIDALAAGDTSVALKSVGKAAGRDDEIGRMAQAIDRFRTQRVTLGRLQRAQERQRRRQETFIHREMTDLAGTLAPLAREEVLRDLREVEASEQGGAGLGVMGAAFRKMSVRVRQQQQHLEELIAELREALKMKTAFVQLQQELDIARQIQKSMLPLTFPADRPEIALHARMEPAKEVGGDFYDFFFIDTHRLGVVIADVSGKGVPAALFMAISRTLLRATALFGSPPGPCLENLNNMLAENNEKNLFVTVFYGILDMRDGTFTYANAGHNPPLWLRADGSVEVLPRTGGAALAIMEDLPQTDRAITLAPGEQLFLFTDGINEAQNAAEELFGDARLVAGLGSLTGKAPAEVIDGVLAAVQDFVAEAPQFDDITCLAVRWNQPQEQTPGQGGRAVRSDGAAVG
ncbi:PP2C family protein-serine/threonine phosphatase [Novispirillum sp. DQ9]|uniref:PP2C family protein-serine/threonine phosphatase n=1 Tax=Novispirillum sp. DQ9 TaxID=3398612 RepID=UPI003C7B2F09